jgi:hypothetical protein
MAVLDWAIMNHEANKETIRKSVGSQECDVM